MYADIIKLAASQGLWAVLSVSLIFYILKAQNIRDQKQAEREENYQNIISKLTDEFNIIENVKDDIKEIKSSINR